MQSNSQNDTQGGGLNFVFETGSSGRENKKYVRSHAAKVGWSQRSRNRDTRRESIHKEETSPRKRRKTQPGPSASQFPSQRGLAANVPSTSSNQVVDTNDLASARRPSHSLGHTSAHQHVTRGEPGLVTPQRDIIHDPCTAFSSYLPAPRLAWASSTQYPSSGPQQGTRTLPDQSSYSTNTATRETATAPSPARPYLPLPHHEAVYHQFHRTSGPASAWQGQPTASDVLLTPDVHNNFRPVFFRQQLAPPLFSPVPPLPFTDEMHPPVHPTLAQAPWRQYDESHIASPTVSQSCNQMNDISQVPRVSQQEGHTEEVEKALKARATAVTVHITPPPTRSASPRFFDVVLNPEYPLCPPVDSGNDSFGVFPVKWQPFYGRMLENYRSNMLVQLEEIMTGWSLGDKLEFNQMPLRLSMSEPTLFYALLAAAAIMMPPGRISPRIPQWFQSRTVETLNDAFSSPERASSNAVILTINLVALIESIGGNAQATASLHQPALRKLVNLRGGLCSLSSSGTRDALNLVRFLAWTDRVIWCQTGNQLVFPEFQEDPTVSGTDWEDIWARMERRVERNDPAPLEELPDDD